MPATVSNQETAIMSEQSAKIVNEKQFVALIKAASEAKTRQSSISGDIGERLKHAAEDGGLHKGAFALVLKLHRWDEQKRDEFLRQFEIYCEMAENNGLFGEKHVGDLADMAADDPDADAADKNSKLLSKGIKRLEDSDDEFDDASSSKPSRRNAANKFEDNNDDDEAAGSYSLQ